MGSKRSNSPKFYVNGHQDADSHSSTADRSSHDRSSSKKLVCGVLLVDERISTRTASASLALQIPAPEQHRPDYKNYVLLGSLLLERVQLQQACDRLRPILADQIKPLPENYCFLSISGWPIERTQESKLTISSVFNDLNSAIAIKKNFDKPRLGVINTNGDSIGFVFCSLEQSLLSLRASIDELLREAVASSGQTRVEFKFVDRNGWPVLMSQERSLAIPDVLVNHSVCIKPRLLDMPYRSPISGTISMTEEITSITPGSCLALPEPENRLTIGIPNMTGIGSAQGSTPEDESDWKRKSKKGGSLIRRNTSILKRNKDKNSKKPRSRAKPIMLSYARNEAANHAIQLKLELVALGFSVYLDVHEIQNGSDWQDALNEAVTNCEVFVPLITPMYGKTQWTNREVKLADLLKKTIIPVNFMDNWPPECLAIQFATTQYIPWRPIEGNEPNTICKDIDIRHWPQKFVKRVCKLVAEQVPNTVQPNVTPLRKGSHQQVLSPITPMGTFTPMTPAVEHFSFNINGPVRPISTSALIENNPALANSFGAPGQSFNGSNASSRPLIVIDAHPLQRHLADEIRRALEKDDYDVWCSCDSQADSGVEMDSPESGDSGANLSTIVECNEHGLITSARSTIDSLNSPDPTRRVSLEGGQHTLDIPDKSPKSLSRNGSPQPRSPNRSPNRSCTNLFVPEAKEEPSSLKIVNGNKVEFNATPTSSTSVNVLRRQLANRRPTSLPVGKMEQNGLGERKRISRLLSQVSDISFSTLPPEKMERLQKFQDKVLSAEMVILLVSTAYMNSRTSQKHAYYCEHRKKIVLVRVDEGKVVGWFANLLGEDIPLSIHHPRYMELLRNRVRRKMDGGLRASSSRDIAESKIQYLISYFKKNVPVPVETCVYVIGSTRLQSERSVQICQAIGRELANLKNVIVVTSGFKGAGDLVARSFYDCRLQYMKEKLPQLYAEMMEANTPGNGALKWPSSFPSQVMHILPMKEQRDFSDKCTQNPDGTFDQLDYGYTFFMGESMKERETVVARLLNTCILIEGGPGTASEAEEFIWNDSYVIPVVSTGGAASGQFGVPMKIFECPTGVDEQDWQRLSDHLATPEEAARGVFRILVCLKQNIAACAKFHQLDQIGANGNGNTALGSLGLASGNKMKKSLRKKRLSEKFEQLSRTPSIASVQLETVNGAASYTPNVAVAGGGLLPVVDCNAITPTKPSRWWKMQKIISFTSKKY